MGFDSGVVAAGVDVGVSKAASLLSATGTMTTGPVDREAASLKGDDEGAVAATDADESVALLLSACCCAAAMAKQRAREVNILFIMA